MDLLTAITATVVSLLGTKKPEGVELYGWPSRVSDVEKTPWCEVEANHNGVEEASAEGDRRLVLVGIRCRQPEDAPGEAMAWIEDALGRSMELPEKLSNSTVKVWVADFSPPSANDDGADYWERLYLINLECALICGATTT